MGILSGLRIVEVSAFVAAPLGGMTLAQLGADVIRVDPIGGGADANRWPVTQEGRSLYWAGLNKGKRSLTVDLRRREGQALIADLLAAPGEGSGILLTNLQAGGWLGYDRLKERRPDLIMVQITGNHDGSTALDYTVNSAVGFPLVTGPTGYVEPVNHVLPAWDGMCGLTAAVGILAAERHRRLTGEGQQVRLSLSDIAFAYVGALGFIGEVEINGAERPAIGNHLYGTFGRDFATADGRRVMILAITDRHWDVLVELMGLQEKAKLVESLLGVDLRREGDRYRARHVLQELIAPWVAARTLAQVGAALEGARLPWGPYQSFSQMVAEDPRCSTQNPMFEVVDQPGIGAYRAPGTPIAFSSLAREPVRPAPLYGQHTDEVLAGVLGLDAAAIERLHADGIVKGMRE